MMLSVTYCAAVEIFTFRVLQSDDHEIFGIDPLKDMEEMFERLSGDMDMSMDNFGQHPFVYGFSVTQRPGEEPEIREFGNILGILGCQGTPVTVASRMPSSA